MSISQGIAIAIAAIAIGWLFWLHYIRPWLMPVEGLEKVVFVIGCWWGGGWFAYYGLTRQLYYWGASLLIGLLMLALGTRMAWRPFQRYRLDRIMFGSSGTSSEVAELRHRSRQETDKAA